MVYACSFKNNNEKASNMERIIKRFYLHTKSIGLLFLELSYSYHEYRTKNLFKASS